MVGFLQYFSFLRDNFFDDLVKKYQQIAENTDFPLRHFLFNGANDNTFPKISEYVDAILSWLETNVFIEKQKELIQKISSEFFLKNKMSLPSVHSFFFLQKELLIKHVEDFTKEAGVILDIVTFLERNYHEIEVETTDVYVRIKEKETKILIENGVRLKLLMQESANMVFIYSSDKQFLYITPCIEDITGFKQEEVMGLHVEEIVHPEDLSVMEKMNSDIFEASKPVKKSFRLKKKNGNYIWVESKPCLVKDSQGNIMAIHWIVSDITEQIENEKKLYQLAAIVESTSDAIFSRSRDGIIMSWNPGAEKLLGYTATGILGRNYSIFIPNALSNELAQVIENINMGESIQDMEMVFLKKDRTPINVSLTISPIMNELGNVIGESFVVRDITEKIQLEKALLESEQKYSQIVEDAVDAMYTCDFQGNFTYVNPAFKKMTGYEPEEVIGRNFTKLIDPEWKEKVRLFYNEQFTKRISETVFSFPYLNSKGEEKWVEQTVTLQEQDEWVVGFQSVVRDISDRKKAEDELKESEGRLRQFLEAIPLGIVVRGQDGKTYFSNKRAEEILDETIPEPLENISKYGLYKTGTDELYPVENLPITRALRGERVVVDDIELRRKDKKLQVQGWGAPVYNLKGTVTYAIAVFEDITERKQKEQEILTLKSNLSTVIENIPGNVLFLDQNNRVLYFNENMRNFYKKLGVEVTIGKDVYTLVPPETLPNFKELNKRMFEGENVSVEQSFEIKGEKEYHVIRGNSVRGNDKVIGFCIVGFDITDRIKAEEKIKQSEEKIRKFMEALPFAIFIIDKHGRSYYANKKSVELLGKGVMENASLEQLTQVYKVYKAGSNELYPFDQFPINKALVGESTYLDDMEISQNDKRIPIQVYGDPVFDEQGNVAYAIAAFEDITYRKKMERQQAEMIQDLARKNKELNDFAFVVSHDLKAPLRAIGSISKWIQSDYNDKLDEEGKNKLNLLVEKVHILDKLIDGVLHYSRIGRITESKVEINMENLIHEQIELLSPPPDIHLQIETAMPVIYIDKTLIAQVFQNLISNAIKFMDKPEGKIKIGCVDKEDNYTFYVADNGPGIEKKYQEKIFGLFQSVSPQEKEPAGIGLTIVKKIIESKNGKIWVQSKPGEGSTFFFILPKEEVKVPVSKIPQEA